MLRVARLLALVALGGVTAACVTDSLDSAGNDPLGAKARVIDTPRTRVATVRMDSAKPAGSKPAPVKAQGDIALRSVVAVAPPDKREETTGSVAPRPASGPAIPAQSLFGNWTLGQDGGGQCRMVLGGVAIGSAYSARSEADCPKGFSGVQTWEIDGDELVLRNQSRGVVGRLAPTGPFRFDGTGAGAAMYLVR